MGVLTAVAHGAWVCVRSQCSAPVSHAKREWFEFTVRQLSLVLMQSLMGETPKTALHR
ncbi:hypothetical protein [Moorena sp. SIO4G3]|uniref:hypothetical protein n=1 Tax=Moorena sp. SIO4G3 TaxID=2607821 RepID=UPI0025E53453|nr:hypothetical protein [Moorena sp. SIO4G3]